MYSVSTLSLHHSDFVSNVFRTKTPRPVSGYAIRPEHSRRREGTEFHVYLLSVSPCILAQIYQWQLQLVEGKGAVCLQGRVAPAYDIEFVSSSRCTLCDYCPPVLFSPVAHEEQLVFSVLSCFTAVQPHSMAEIDTLLMT